jgi:DNA mismatch repair ATPase MutS
MMYLLFFLLLLTIAGMVSLRNNKIKERKKITALHGQWGMAKNAEFNFNHISLFNEVNKEKKFHQLSEQTKSDIDFDDLFCLADRTTSNVGQQYLYDVLSKPISDIAALKQLNEQADFFTTNEKIREEVQQLLIALSNSNSYFIASLLNDQLPQKPSWYKFLLPYMACIFLLIVIAFFRPVMFLLLMLPFSVNVFLHFRNRNLTKRFSKSFPQLNVLIRICEKLTEKNIPFDDSTVNKSIQQLKPLQRKSRLLTFDDATFKDELTQTLLYFFELIKAFFLIEFFTFYSMIQEVKNKQTHILNLFKYAGLIDTAISIASLRAGHFKTCQPVFLPDEKQLSGKVLYHPLIADCVSNDIEVKLKSILITGSNMSGKTTFLRTLALNSIMAQTIYTCFADSFNTPVLKLHSSVRIDDNLLDGKSYYFEEVTVMGALIKEVTEPGQSLFVLDEVFKGTNTIERIASAKAILSYLNKNNHLVFVTTHDVELAAMLADEYELYHFAEKIENDEFHFDHKLKPGPLKTSNAIRILEMYNYPPEIIAEARTISKNLSVN